jgi:D-alanine-D-alanine ligase
MDTVYAIRAALERLFCRVTLLEADETLPAKLIANRPDIVFNIAEGKGGRGREAQVPAILNFLGIPFTGSDETTLCICLDKALTKKLLSREGIRIPRFRVVGPQGSSNGHVGFPAIVKPNAEGSSKGISNMAVVEDHATLRELLNKNLTLYRQEMLIEQYIPGREFTVGILGNGQDTRVFEPMEIIYLNQDIPYQIYSFEVKQNYKQLIRYDCPANAPAQLRREMTDTALKIYKLLGCRDFARIDFRLSPAGELYFIEINPLPGLAPGYSDYPMIAAFQGVSYEALVQGVLLSALRRIGLKPAVEV